MTPFHRKAAATARGLTVAVGASLPISIALDNLLLPLLLFAWLAADHFPERLARLRANRAALAVLAFLALLALGCLWGPGSLRAGWQQFYKQLNLLAMPLLATLFVRQTDKRRALWAFGLSLIVTLAGSYAIWLELLSLPPNPLRGADNPVVFKGPLQHSVLLALGAYLAAMGAWYERGAVLRILLLLACLAAAGNVLFLVRTPAACLTLAVLMSYFFFVAFRRIGLALWLAAAIAAGLAAHALGSSAPSRLVGEIAAGLHWSDWRPALAIIREHPILGVGTGGFEAAYRTQLAAMGLVASANPYNQYLLSAAQLGVMGLAALLAMLVLMWREAARLNKPQQLSTRGAVLTIAVTGLFDAALLDHTEGLLLAWMTGVMLGFPAPEAAPAESRRDDGRPR